MIKNIPTIVIYFVFNWEIQMFGMTKRQFLKKSKKSLDEMGSSLLLIIQIMDKEIEKKISNNESSIRMDNIRKNIELVFSEFEKLSPPSKCFSLYHRILNALIKLHEAVIINCESLKAEEDGFEEESQEKLIESIDNLEEFREDFHTLVKDVRILLLKKNSLIESSERDKKWII